MPLKWIIMSIFHGTSKSGVCKFCFTEKFSLLKHCEDKILLNKKPGLISKSRDENRLLVKSAENM